MMKLYLLLLPSLTGLTFAAPRPTPLINGDNAPDPLNLSLTPAQSLRLENRGVPVLDVEMGWWRTHVGSLEGVKMYESVKDCLNFLCGPRNPVDKPCFPMNLGCSIKGIDYEGKNREYKTDGEFLLQVTAADFHSNTNGQREALIEMMSGLYRSMTETFQNQFDVKLDGWERRFSNVNHYNTITVQGVAGGGKLEVWSTFKGKKTKGGHFDCVGSLDKANGFMFGRVIPMLKEVFHVGAVDGKAWCPKREVTHGSRAIAGGNVNEGLPSGKQAPPYPEKVHYIDVVLDPRGQRQPE